MKTLLYLTLSIFLLIFYACSKPGNESQNPEELLKGTDTLVVEYSSYVDSFPLPSNVNIQISTSPTSNWINTRVSTNSAGQKYLVIEIQSNTDLSKRSVTLTITATGTNIPTKDLKVIQNGYSGSYLNANKTQITLGGGYGSIDSISIQSNVGWIITINPSSNWVNISSLSGQNNTKIVLTATSDNNSNAQRTVTITITPQNGAGIPSVNITIMQNMANAGIVWNKTFGESNLDQFTSVTKVADGGIVVAGIAAYTVSTSYTTDAWLVKTDATGSKLWEKKYGGTNGDAVSAVVTTTDGGFILAGFATSNDGDLTGTNPINGDAWIIKTDGSGNKTWSKIFGGANFEYAAGIVQTADGGYVFCATTKSNDGNITFNYGGDDVWIVKINPAGTLVWQKTFGGSNDDNATGIVVDANGNIIVSATTKSNDGDVAGFLGGSSDGWVIKLDGNGNKLWAKTIGGVFADEANALCIAQDGNYAVAGNTFSYVTGWRYNGDMMMIKLDKNGNQLIERAIGSFELDKAYGITSTTDGGFVLTGYVSAVGGDVSSPQFGVTDLWIVKIDAAGNKIWDKTFGSTGHDRGFAVVNINNNFLVAGYIANNASTGSASYIIQQGLLLKVNVQ